MPSFLLFASRHRRALLVVAAAVTAFLGAGLTRLRVETNILDWLPQGEPNVRAFRGLFENLPDAVNQELIWLELDPKKKAKAGVDKITDARSYFAQEELLAYIKASVPEIKGEFGLLPFLKASGGLPRSPAAVALKWRLIETFGSGFVKAFLSEDQQATVLSVMLNVPPLSREAQAVGLKLKEALDAYREDESKTYDLFLDHYLVPAGLASGTAEVDASLRRDLLLLTPVAVLFLVFVLRAFLGGWRPFFAIVVVLVMGSIWNLGLLGWLGTPLNIVTVGLVPLVLGCGIDYAILVTADTQDRRAAGLSPERVYEQVTRGSVTAVFLTTLTTVAGLLVLVLSDSPGMTALGYHAAAAMASLGLVAMLLPVFLPRLESTRHLRLGRGVAAIAARLSRHRVKVFALWVLVTAYALFFVPTPVVQLDVIEGNYSEDMQIRQTVREIRRRCGGAFPEMVIARGDLSSPVAMERLEGIAQRIAASPVLGETYRVIGAPQILKLSGLLGFGKADLSSAQSVRERVQALYGDETWGSLLSLFLDRDCTTGTILLLGGDAGTDPQAVERVWTELETLIAAEVRPDDPLSVSFLGYRTMSYLFTTYSWRWVGLTAAMALVVVVVLGALFLRRLRAVVLVAALMAGGAIWWFALLQAAGIYLSIFLLFPVVFALCVGSDYGLHILCGLHARRSLSSGAVESRAESHWRVWSSAGRGITIAALTDAGVFLIYSRMELVSASSVMTAVALAVATAFVSTLLLVPSVGE